MAKRLYNFYGTNVHIEKVHNQWESWIAGEDHTTFIAHTKSECLADVRSAIFSRDFEKRQKRLLAESKS